MCPTRFDSGANASYPTELPRQCSIVNSTGFAPRNEADACTSAWCAAPWEIPVHHRIRRAGLAFAVLLLAGLLSGCYPNVDGSQTGPRAEHTLTGPSIGYYLDDCAVQDCTIADEIIKGDVYVDGVHVTISDVEFNGDLGGGNYADFAVRTINGGTVEIEYTSFSNYDVAGIAESGWSCNWCEFTGMRNDGVLMGHDSSLTNSLMVDFATVAPNHADGVQIQASGADNILIEHNTIVMTTDQTRPSSWPRISVTAPARSRSTTTSSPAAATRWPSSTARTGSTTSTPST